MPCLNAKMYSPKMGFNQAYSCALESLQSCPWSSPLKKMSAPKEMMQTSHCRSCNCNTCQSIFAVDPALQQDGHSFSKPLFQGIGHPKPTHSLLLSRMSSSAPLRFVWLKFNPIELREADEPCAAAPWASREREGCTQSPGDGEQLRPDWPLPPAACNFSFFRSWGVTSPWVGWCSLDQELSNRWGRSTLITVQ